ncbi:hypothetical protein HNQ69_000272 [Bartonella callosciuri]|uniref:Uncharacterized protein n=1 Tax=Bartonella callosciuri TaxID=686223 RepID=A0A840NRY8_9HYPH|nr:hypothetical protein [Bartonella callosciuri]MBB5073168.1 hypothetical protein [Bartonella callosciuri]
MELFWRRLLLILFVFFVFAASLFASRNAAVYRFISDRSFSPQSVNVTEDIILERLATSFPDIIDHLSKISVQQQKQLIEQVRQNTIAAAFADGQSREDALKLGETVATALLKAIAHPSLGDSYF